MDKSMATEKVYLIEVSVQTLRLDEEQPIATMNMVGQTDDMVGDQPFMINI